jgi:polar amino acid transport system permease protein
VIWSNDFFLQCLPVMLKALPSNLTITLYASIVALAMGLVFALIERSDNPILTRPIAWFVRFIRRTPILVQLYFLFYILPDIGIYLSASVAGIIGLGLHNSAYVCEIYRVGINNVDRGQWDAAKALNLPKVFFWRSIIIPQALVPMIPSIGNYIVIIFKETALLTFITVYNVMSAAQNTGSDSFRYLEPMTLLALIFLVICYPAMLALRKMEVGIRRSPRFG